MDKYNNFSNGVHKEEDERATARAYVIILLDYNKSDIIRILSENDEEIKPFAIINLKSLDSKAEADMLLLHSYGV